MLDYRTLFVTPYEPQAGGPIELPPLEEFAGGPQALDFYGEVIRAVQRIQRPWITPPDALRQNKAMIEQFKEDWPGICLLCSPEECHYLSDAWRHLLGLGLAWQYADSLLGDEPEGSEEKGILLLAREVRDELLTLGRLSYKGRVKIITEIERILARSDPHKSLYDEFATDLSDSVALFKKNPFEQQGVILYPEELLKKAAQLATELPLLRPAKPDKKEDAPLPLLYQAFTLMAACYYRLQAAGRFLHAFDDKATRLYPGLYSTKAPSPPA